MLCVNCEEVVVEYGVDRCAECLLKSLKSTNSTSREDTDEDIKEVNRQIKQDGIIRLTRNDI